MRPECFGSRRWHCTDYVGELVWLRAGIRSSTVYERGSWHPPVQYTSMCHFVQLKAQVFRLSLCLATFWPLSWLGCVSTCTEIHHYCESGTRGPPTTLLQWTTKTILLLLTMPLPLRILTTNNNNTITTNKKKKTACILYMKLGSWWASLMPTPLEPLGVELCVQ